MRYGRCVALAYPDPRLTDGVVRLRPWRLDDADCVRQAAASDPSISAWTTVPPVYTIEEGRSYIERQWSRIENAEGISLVVTDAASDEPLGKYGSRSDRSPVSPVSATGSFRTRADAGSRRARSA